VPKYLFVADYSTEGIRGVLSEGGVSRRDAIEQLAQSVGGTLESFYFAFGSDDAFVVCDLPDDESAAAVAMTVAASGKASARTTTLLTPEQIDAATRRSPAYRPPGD
jgi:uncharacterized protein with GYD domain